MSSDALKWWDFPWTEEGSNDPVDGTSLRLKVAQGYLLSNAPDLALTELTSGVADISPTPEVCSLIGLSLVLKGGDGPQKQAIKHLRRGLEHADRAASMALHYNLARIYEMRQDYKKAIAHYYEIIPFDAAYRDVPDRMDAIFRSLPDPTGGPRGAMSMGRPPHVPEFEEVSRDWPAWQKAV